MVHGGRLGALARLFWGVLGAKVSDRGCSTLLSVGQIGAPNERQDRRKVAR
jgi:hypothetical protein